jgi:hypothetical protein
VRLLHHRHLLLHSLLLQCLCSCIRYAAAAFAAVAMTVLLHALQLQ